MLDSIPRITCLLQVKKEQNSVDNKKHTLFANYYTLQNEETGAISTATPFLDFLRSEGEHQNLASLLKPTQQLHYLFESWIFLENMIHYTGLQIIVRDAAKTVQETMKTDEVNSQNVLIDQMF